MLFERQPWRGAVDLLGILGLGLLSLALAWMQKFKSAPPYIVDVCIAAGIMVLLNAVTVFLLNRKKGWDGTWAIINTNCAIWLFIIGMFLELDYRNLGARVLLVCMMLLSILTLFIWCRYDRQKGGHTKTYHTKNNYDG